MVRGEAWLLPTTARPGALGPGDVAIIRGPDPYTVADDPATPPQVVILPGQRCVTPDGREVARHGRPRRAHWGNSPDGATVMLTGTYQLEGEVSRPPAAGAAAAARAARATVGLAR